MADYGNRPSGEAKGLGFFGEVPRPGGGFSTELSAGVNIDGREVELPLMVPTLTREELDLLLNDGEPNEVIFNKAINHALERMKAGKSPFAMPGEPLFPVPQVVQPTPLEEVIAPGPKAAGGF